MTRCGSRENSCARACVSGAPCGVIKTTQDSSRRIVSTASKIGSGFISIPGPPPYGLSSTTRCLSWVKSRKLCTRTATNPFFWARLRMLSSSGPSKMRGNNVSTSISIPAPATRTAQSLHRVWRRWRTFRATAFGFDDFQHGPLALFGGGAGQQGADCRDGAPAFADYLADIGLVQPQFKDHGAFAIDFAHIHFLRVIDQGFRYVFDKRFHIALPS